MCFQRPADIRQFGPLFQLASPEASKGQRQEQALRSPTLNTPHQAEIATHQGL